MNANTQVNPDFLRPRIDLAHRLSIEANAMIGAAFNRRNHALTEKSTNDFATETDAAVEAHIAARVEALFPGDVLLGEEGGERSLGNAPNTAVRWIVDPLDGTYNFVHGFPYVASSIAIEFDHEICFGVVGAPLQNERFSAQRGCGAWLHDENGAAHRLHVSKCDALATALVGSVLPSGAARSFEQVLPAWTAVARSAGSIRRTGAAALDLAYVAAGRLDGFFVMSLSAWDAAAGSLLVHEAGGAVRDFSGGDRFLQTNQVIAGSPCVANGLIRVLTAHATAQ